MPHLHQQVIQLLPTDRAQHHITVLPVEYTGVQNACYIKLLMYNMNILMLSRKKSRSGSWSADNSSNAACTNVTLLKIAHCCHLPVHSRPKQGCMLIAYVGFSRQDFPGLWLRLGVPVTQAMKVGLKKLKSLLPVGRNCSILQSLVLMHSSSSSRMRLRTITGLPRNSVLIRRVQPR